MTDTAAIPLAPIVEVYKTDPHMTKTKWVRWAVLCAERTLPLFEQRYPDDTRPRDALDAAKAWIDNPAQSAAARAAARAAADAAAADAADAAAYAARAAAYAAHAAAYATRAATRAAEEQWQAITLMEVYHD